MTADTNPEKMETIKFVVVGDGCALRGSIENLLLIVTAIPLVVNLIKEWLC